MDKRLLIRHSPFALRIVQRKDGKAAIIYQRKADKKGRDRLQRVAALAPLAFTASIPLLRDAASKSMTTIAAAHHRKSNDSLQILSSHSYDLATGAFHPLDADWGARVACYAILASGLRDGERLIHSANHLRDADPNEAAWWLGLLTQNDNIRAIRALRILTEAVQ